MVIKVNLLRVDRGFSFREVWTAGTLYLASNRPQVRIHLLHLLVNVETLIKHHLRLLGGVLVPESSQDRMLLAKLLGKNELFYFGDDRV